ncbi:unnamed protein product, partial [Urochloa humidicola]
HSTSTCRLPASSSSFFFHQLPRREELDHPTSLSFDSSLGAAAAAAAGGFRIERWEEKKMVAECRGGGGGGDCLIKLFGKTIPVPEATADKESGSSSSVTESDAPEISAHQEQEASDPTPQPEVVDAEDPKSSPETTTRRQPSAGAGDAASEQRDKLKKPDKVLPCPRCNSMDTKFCYFNNYNVNQPRHFCKNCQRYWTAGGAMRNVPVGAGRRKNKHAAAASHFLHRVRAALPAADPLGAHGGTVLSFASHGHGALHDLADQVNRLNEKLLIPARRNAGGGNPPPPPVGACSEGSSSSTDDDKTTHGGGGKEKPSAGAPPPQHPASMNGHGAAMWPPYSCAPSPAYFSSGIAIPIYPAAPGYWGCMVPAAPGAWSLPWPAAVQPPPQGLSSPTSTTAPSVSLSSSGAESLTLGKHGREVDEGRSGGHGHSSGNKVWAPKTIRIDDADDVARSSIWSLIGIKGDKQKQNADHGVGHKLGTVFEPKHEAMKAVKPAMITSSPTLLHTNPVALTRSVTFQEGA